jgi:hypothetical protein
VAELKQGGTSLTASGSFFLVFLSVTNQGQEPLSFSPSDFSLHDQQGRKFTVHSEATKLASLTNQKSDLFSEALQPGLGRETVLVFDVPKESTGLSLRLSNGYLDVSLGQWPDCSCSEALCSLEYHPVASENDNTSAQQGQPLKSVNEQRYRLTGGHERR